MARGNILLLFATNYWDYTHIDPPNSLSGPSEKSREFLRPSVMGGGVAAYTGHIRISWGELRGKIVLRRKTNKKIFLSSHLHITIHLTLEVGSNPSHVTPYFILGWNRWNVWFGIKVGSEPPGCILYLSSFSSEYTWVLLNRPNGHWETPGLPSNTCSKVTIPQHRTYERRYRWLKIDIFGSTAIK